MRDLSPEGFGRVASRYASPHMQGRGLLFVQDLVGGSRPRKNTQSNVRMVTENLLCMVVIAHGFAVRIVDALDSFIADSTRKSLPQLLCRCAKH